MNKSEIDKIKEELLRLNNIAHGFLKTDTRNDTVIRLTKALEIAVDFIQVNEIEYRNEFMDKAADNNNMILKQIKETLQNDS